MCEIGKTIKMVKMCNDCSKHEISCIGSDKQQEKCYFENLLDELFNLKLIEDERQLTEDENKRYVELVGSLNENKIDIDFGISL